MPDMFSAVPGVHPNELEVAVALGTVPGWRTIRRWNENPTVDSTQEEMSNIASGIRVLPSSATVITIASSSAEDGAGTLTGILTVRIWYLDANWDEKVEDVTLNGTGNVTTVGTAIRLQNCEALTTGSAGGAVGNITITIDGNPQTRILIGQNADRESALHVPRGHIFVPTVVTSTTGRSGATDTDLAFEWRDGLNETPWLTLASFEVYEKGLVQPFALLAFPAYTDYRVLAESSASGPDCHVLIRGYLIRTDHL